MIVFPAIDLLDGKCVRLVQGSYDDVTIYDDDPVRVATEYHQRGGAWLHVVDLEGARDPTKRQTALIKKMVQQSGLRVQVGGGVRSLEDARAWVDAGVQRVIVGSLAVRDPQAVLTMASELGAQHIVIGMDVRIDEAGALLVATHGWKKASALDVDDWLGCYLQAGITQVLCTDIGRDGMLSGPNLKLYEQLRVRFPQAKLLASGGVSCLQDLQAVRDLGLAGVIVGKALYEKRFTLEEALAC